MRRPFVLRNHFDDPVRRALFAGTRPAFERALALNTLNDIYEDVVGSDDPGHFCDKALASLGISFDVDAHQLEQIPRDGPLVVVSNHPFGGVEGLVMLALLRRARSDVRILANHLLGMIPELADSFFLVDPFGSRKSTARNVSALRSAIRWLKSGGVLGVFPAGEVAHLSLRQRRVLDPPWDPSIGRMVHRTGATVLPIYFDGRNSDLFQLLGLLHPRLRTVMLPREMLRRRHSRMAVQIGSPIPYRRFASMSDPEALTAHLRMRTYILKGRLQGGTDKPAPQRQVGAPIIAARLPNALRRDIEGVPSDQVLLGNEHIRVLYARTAQVPTVIREIGRLRELTFRAVGEGTGRAVDLDRFDDWYLHLIAWDQQAQQIVGAYRMGPTDEILARYGTSGLYTSTLFHYRPTLLEQISPALELGRSFVHPDYQKSYAPLMMLWKGIGAYAVANPRYRMMFGPVSISSDYRSISKQILMTFLRLNRYLPDLGRLLRPRHPPRLRPDGSWDLRQTSTGLKDISEVDELIRDIEADRKSIPVLLRQYLKLNGVLLGFNVDPDFGDVLDGLMLVDLCRVDRNVLDKYMGKEGARGFLAHHGDTNHG